MLNSPKIHFQTNLKRKKLLSKNHEKIVRLLKRADFAAMRSKFRVQANGLNLQARKRTTEELLRTGNQIRVGFTCSKKVGNATRRNFAKRRLKHLARECLPVVGKNGWDYNLVGTSKTSEEKKFDNLKKSFVRAVKKVHRLERS